MSFKVLLAASSRKFAVNGHHPGRPALWALSSPPWASVLWADPSPACTPGFTPASLHVSLSLSASPYRRPVASHWPEAVHSQRRAVRLKGVPFLAWDLAIARPSPEESRAGEVPEHSRFHWQRHGEGTGGDRAGTVPTAGSGTSGRGMLQRATSQRPWWIARSQGPCQSSAYRPGF